MGNSQMEFGQVISRIYDASTSDNDWGEAMDALTYYVGAKASILLMHGSNIAGDWHRQKASELWRSTSLSQRVCVATMFDAYDAEARQRILSGEKLLLHSDTDLWSVEELKKRPDLIYYQEKFGVRRRLATRLSDHPGWAEVLALQFDQKYSCVSQSSRQALSEVVQHVAKAVELNRSFALLQNRYHAVLSVLDHVLVGVCIAMPNGEIIIANREAQRIFDLRDSVWLSDDCFLVSRHHDIASQIKRAVAAAVSAAEGEVSSTECLFNIVRVTDSSNILVEVSPIRDSLGELQSNFEGALIYLIDPDGPAPIKIERFALQCGLSVTEAVVCELVANGWTNCDIADDRNVSPCTVKSQIASVFSKTCVRNRSELVRLILKSSPPVD